MKRTILLLLVAVLSVTVMYAENARKVTYVIDGKEFANFDGSQLEGKTIGSYTIDTKVENLDLHIIFTKEYLEQKANNQQVSDVSLEFAPVNSENIVSKDNVICVVDGNFVPYEALRQMPSSKVHSMTVIKDQDAPAYKKYAKEASKYGVSNPKGIIEIKTK